MRRLGFLMITVLAGGFATMALPGPATADYDYPWCLQGRSLGYPGDCAFQNYAQCMATASGRDLGCGINPRVAFRQQRQDRRVRRDYGPQW